MKNYIKKIIKEEYIKIISEEKRIYKPSKEIEGNNRRANAFIRPDGLVFNFPATRWGHSIFAKDYMSSTPDKLYKKKWITITSSETPEAFFNTNYGDTLVHFITPQQKKVILKWANDYNIKNILIDDYTLTNFMVKIYGEEYKEYTEPPLTIKQFKEIY